jgi:DNA-binding transcriptional regulator YhcF (GntR family)
MPSMLPTSAMTDNGKALPKYARVAAAVRRQIADGTLRPGQPVPSGAALSRVTGYSTLTCRRALRVLVADGVLVPGPSRNARPRVAGAAQQPAERDLAAAARTLSAALAGRRRAHGLTQPELARRAGVSVTTIGHAETGRLWQSREFWDRADAVLGARGDLLRLHDDYRAAGAAGAHERPAASDPAWRRDTVVAGEGDEAAPACVMIMWGDGTMTTVRPPQRVSPPAR